MIKFTKSEWHAEWEIGEYAIRWDRRHSCFDVSKGNVHHYCTCSFKDAVGKVLELQGWGNRETVLFLMTQIMELESWDNTTPLTMWPVAKCDKCGK